MGMDNSESKLPYFRILHKTNRRGSSVKLEKALNHFQKFRKDISYKTEQQNNIESHAKLLLEKRRIRSRIISLQKMKIYQEYIHTKKIEILT